MAEITWTMPHFAEGGFKRAYWASVKSGPWQGFETGTKLVMKGMSPDSWNQGCRVTASDAEASAEACRLAKIFNDEAGIVKCGQPVTLEVRKSYLMTMNADKYHGGRRTFCKDEVVMLEQPIHGKFEKFNSNSGWSCGKANLPDAFSHWTWVHSGGELLACDMQGYRGDPNGIPYDGKRCYYYLLTDPAILSRDRRFGLTDLGQSGIETWFANHRCNDLCRSLRLEDRRPKRMVRAFSLVRGTTFRPM